ncbi:hypothetical protein, partial [Klebsiella pneumoniae]|uniref:hypothetical protein n=1 Tax=Klebsiella pneumoniae TaxID=573 RepID=UPI00196262D4
TITYLSDIGCLEIHGASLIGLVRKRSLTRINAALIRVFSCPLRRNVLYFYLPLCRETKT